MNLLSRPPSPVFLRGLAAASLLGLCGCASLKTFGQAQSDGVAVPAKWKAAGSNVKPLDTAALAKWWQRFRDPVLNQLVTEAQATSPDLRTALSRIRESRARRGVQVANLFPTVNAGATGRTSRDDNRQTGVSSSESYGASADLSWEIDLFGRNRENIKAASADLAQAQENYYGAQVALTADVAEAYISLRQAEAQLRVVENSLKTREETFDITKWREQAGVGSGLDTLQLTSTLEQARATIPSLRQTISQTRNQLSLLAGRPPGALDSLLGRSREIPLPPARIAVGIPAETLRQRPDVRAAERAIEAAIARRRSANAERYPSLSLSGTIGVDALKAGRIFSPENTAASILGSLSAPIFDAGRIRQNINIQSEVEKQALIAYETTVLTALSEVENALIAVQRNAERLVILEKATSSARQAETLARQQYDAGQVDLLVVLEAQRTLLSSEDQLATTRADQASAHIQLYRALGGGWSAR